MSENVLETKNLTKIYQKRKVVNAVNLTVKRKDIYGFIGKNGAGKTTFMRTCLGMARKSYGECKFFGMENEEIAKRKVGALIEQPALFKNETARTNLLYYSSIFQTNKSEIDNILDYVELKEYANKKVGQFSLGMKQRMGIAIALLGKPEFIILDEPINGLDPIGIKKIRELILRLNNENGISFLISSHLLDELGKIATRYGFLNDGTLVEEVSSKDLIECCRKKTIIEVDQVENAKCIVASKYPQLDIKIQKNMLILDTHSIDRANLNKELVESGIAVRSIYGRQNSLEEYFMEKVGK